MLLSCIEVNSDGERLGKLDIDIGTYVELVVFG